MSGRNNRRTAPAGTPSGKPRIPPVPTPINAQVQAAAAAGRAVGKPASGTPSGNRPPNIVVTDDGQEIDTDLLMPGDDMSEQEYIAGLLGSVSRLTVESDRWKAAFTGKMRIIQRLKGELEQAHKERDEARADRDAAREQRDEANREVLRYREAGFTVSADADATAPPAAKGA